MTDLAERFQDVLIELASLQREVEDLGHFLGSFHAINGLQEARTSVNDCIVRLPSNVK